MTGYLGDRNLPFLEYTENGKGEATVWKQLTAFAGKLLTDGSNLFDRLTRNVISFLCNAHARRKFKALADGGDRAASWVIEQYRQVYRIETLADLQSLDVVERAALRRKHTWPIMRAIQTFLQRRVAKTPPSELFVKAARYFLKRFEGLTRFIDHGDVPPDNNGAESILRIVRPTENNSLFAGSHEHAKRHATASSVMKACTMHKLDPYAWMVDVLGKIARGWPVARRAELLPHIWKTMHQPVALITA